MTPNPRTLVSETVAHRASRPAFAGLLAVAWLLAGPSAAHASLMSPEMEDTVAGYIAIFALCFVPIVLIVLFWMVHVLPEKIAHQRHHPQFEAIKTLCLLSLVFGGLLWPLAWLWAYTKPVFHKMAYGTDTSEPDHAPGRIDRASPEANKEVESPRGTIIRRGPAADPAESPRRKHVSWS